MLNVSKDFTKAVYHAVIEPSAYIILNGKQFIPNSMLIQDEVYDTEKDTFIGSFIAKYGEMELYSEEELSLAPNTSFEAYIGVKKEDGTYEYAPYGTFYMYEVSKDKTDISTIVKFADAKIKCNIPFDSTLITYPITVAQLFAQVAQQCKLKAQPIDQFPNAHFSITKEVFFGYDALCSDVIKAIAQATGTFATITRKDELSLSWFHENTIELSTDDYFTLETQDIFGPINSIVLGRDPQNDNVYLKDEASIAQDGLCEFRIIDNPILDLDREATISALFEHLKGFTYLPYSLEGKGNPAIDAGDRIHMKTLEGALLSSYILQHQILFNGAITSTLEANALSKTEIEYGAASSIEKKLLETELKVDKVEGKITASVKETNTKVEIIEASKRYKVEIVSSNGTVFKNRDIHTVLEAKIYSWDSEITSVVSDESVRWERVSGSTMEDDLWNLGHMEGSKSLIITAIDLKDNATFYATYNKTIRASITLTNVYDGEAGLPGIDGEDGRTTYFHVKYAPNGSPLDTEISDEPNLYIGTYVDFVQADSIHALAYTWVKFEGVDGIAGKNGTDGKTSYVHMRYSNDGGLTFTANDGKVAGSYLGQYTDFEKLDKVDVTVYTWVKIKGDQGLIGPKGVDGKAYYTWLKYADTPTTGMSDDATNKAYIGFAYNKESATESTNYSEYTWSLIKGAKGDTGVPGIKGSDGKQLYTWVKYGTSITGAGLSDDPTGKTYIGLAYNKEVASESTIPTDYTWSLIKGDDGEDGASAVTALLNNDSHTIPCNSAGTPISFLGAETTMSVFVGATDTSTLWSYTIVKTNCEGTSSNGNRTFTTTALSADTGYVDITATRTGYTSVTKRFTLTKSKQGQTGATGAGGQNASSYWLVSSTAVLQKNNLGVYTPTTITFTGKSATGTASAIDYAGRFIISETTDGTVFVNRYTSPANEAVKAYTPSAGIKALKCTMYQANATSTILDEQVIPVITDGSKGENGLSLANGKMLYRDPTFTKDVIEIGVYNDKDNENVTVELIDKPLDCPSLSKQAVEIKNIGTSSPGCGGFTFNTQTREYSIFVYRIIAKIPIGRNIHYTANASGDDSVQHWLSPTIGTGKYEEYLYYHQSGSKGTFLNAGYFYIDGVTGTSVAPIKWYLAYATCFDMTDCEENIEEVAKDIKLEVTTNFNTAIEQTKESIKQVVEQEYITKEDSTEVISSLKSELTQLAGKFEFTFDLKKEIDKANNDIFNNEQEIKKFITFDDGVIIIGQSNSDFRVEISNTKLSFKDGGKEVAYVSNSRFYINEGEIRENLILGNYMFEPRANGNLSLKWKGI